MHICMASHTRYIPRAAQNRQSLQVEALRRLMRPKTKAVFVNFPHNPSGAVASPRQWEDIVSCCSDFDAYLFSDEMYRWLCNSGLLISWRNWRSQSHATHHTRLLSHNSARSPRAKISMIGSGVGNRLMAGVAVILAGMRICQIGNAWQTQNNPYLCRMLELPPTRTLRSAVDTYEKSISLGGMSKSLSMAGIRLGWLVTKDKTLYGRLQLLHDYYSICHAAPSEVITVLQVLEASVRLPLAVDCQSGQEKFFDLMQ